jgi:decaprenylphospho-beta-D-erythro-pentofuranosid-2-ulose 2-reductase
MMDSFRNPQNILLIGANSDIGVGIIKELGTSNRLVKLIVASKNKESLQICRERFEDSNFKFEGHVVNFENSTNKSEVIEQIFNQNQIDLCIIASGYLPRNDIASEDCNEAVKTALINYLGPLEVGTIVMKNFKKQGFGLLILFSSAAAIRPRKDIFNYGAAKAALEHWAVGYSETLQTKAVKLLVVRLGMVRTKMSEGLKEVPFTVDVKDVAKQIKRGLNSRHSIIWVPNKLKYAMFIIKHLPRFVFKRIKVR